MIKPSPLILLCLSLLTGCSGSPLANRFAVNPALEVSPSLSPLPPSPLLSPSSPVSLSPSPLLPPSPSPSPGSPLQFSDLATVSQPFRGYIEDLAQLGILSYRKDQNFQPNSPITRREYARWLIAANNRFYANVPAKQIRLGSENSAPAFADVSSKDPDFPAIQGLAEAGLIPSPLSNDPSASLFRPNANLTREDLIAWKVPLDTRKALPNASIDNLKETWGFQDVAKIDPKVWRGIYGDFQNGDQSNIRRVFGYTTLFQPKKPVTRAEAAATLWYFGFQGDGLSAQEVRAMPEPTPSPSPLLNAPNPSK